MSREHTFKTTILMEDARCFECEIPVAVTYSLDPGYAGDRIDPPCGPTVEIVSIKSYGPEFGGITIPQRFYEDSALIAECFQEDADDYSRGQEFLADQRRDHRMMDWLA